MLQNNKGAALLQVLLVTVVLAGMATMLLRASLSRTTAARQTRRAVSTDLLINSCMAEVNAIWSSKSPEQFKRDLADCCMSRGPSNSCVSHHACAFDEESPFPVVATFANDPASNGFCELTYEVQNAEMM